MTKRKQKKKRFSLITPLLFIAVTGSVGWYFTETIEGALYSAILFFILLILFKIWRKTRGYRRLRKAGIKQIDNMSGEEFEQFLALLFKKRGFKVSMTKASGDYGADIILKDRKDIIAVQAKRYSSTVGVKAVQEVIGAMRMYEATEAWVVTNSYFTRQAEKLAETNEVYLIDRDELIDIILGKK